MAPDAVSPSPTFDPGFSTPAMTAAFSDAARVGAMLEFEAGLALAEQEAAIVPEAAAVAIAAACEAGVADPAGLLVAGWEAGTPVMPLLAEVRARLDPEAGQWLHHGATSQDAIDTGLMLQVSGALDILADGLSGVAAALAGLASTHRTTAMMGRTFLQDAEATTFGLRAAQWLDPVIREMAALRRRRAGLPVQLGGPTGNLSALGADGPEVVAALAERLGLRAPAVAWHADRAPIGLVVEAAARTARSMAKIAGDLVLLAQSGIGEVAMRPGSSSSMAHKRNPIDATRALAAAAVATNSAQLVTGARPHELERAAGAWHVEWVGVPLVFHATGAAVEAVGRSLATLEVDTVAMAANLGGANPHPAVAAAQVWIDRVLADHRLILGGTQ
jgi:3-carboxy-cis,cis-muconate cycloisomerase